MRSRRHMLVAGMIMLVVAAVVFALAAIVTGQSRWNGVALASAVAALGPGLQLVLGTLKVELAAIWAGVAIAAGQGFAGVAETQTIAGLALVTLGVAASTFLRRQTQLLIAGAFVAGLIVVAVWWDPADGLAFGLGLAAGFAFMLWIQLELLAVYRRDRRGRLRSDALISRGSVPILGFDFTAVREELAALDTVSEDLEASLRSDKALLDSLFSKVRVTDLNQAARADLGAGSVSLPVPASTGVHPSNIDACASWLAAVSRGDRLWDGDLWLSKHDGGGGLWYRVRHIVPGDDELDFSQMIVTGTNITELKEAQAALSKLDDAKNEFIANITHEMRNPLAGVVGFSAELVENFDTFPEDTVREMISLIGRQAREISYILDDLMAVAAAEMSALKVTKRAFDVTRLVADVVNTLDIPIDVATEGPLTASADPVRVRQILRNLLTNVERYGGRNRRLEVLAGAGSVRISVIDDGPGLTMERVDQVFGSFGHVGSSDVVGSMGLGLNVSRTLADLMGADLVYERIGGETHFSLDLSLEEAPNVTRADS